MIGLREPLIGVLFMYFALIVLMDNKVAEDSTGGRILCWAIVLFSMIASVFSWRLVLATASFPLALRGVLIVLLSVGSGYLLWVIYTLIRMRKR